VSSTVAKTSFFKSCLGVFQGGGCRAAAFVGAYEEAVRSGVSFTEVAGTSAGSIVAALIGAGATPKDLREAITRMDFESFLCVPDRAAARGIFGRLLGMKFPRYADLLFDQGFHSSSRIRQWVDEQLAHLLPQERQPVTFNSLPFPTYIVSTDLTRSEAKVWNQKTTPNELVSDAVQASCAIPIFFQPVSRRYVDGGVLSNLPTFVFFDREQSYRALASRVLAFALMADQADEEEWGTENFLRLLANTIVDGNQQLQLNLQSNVHLVTIPTGDIKATDFRKMTSQTVDILIKNGEAATRTFFEQELLRMQQPITSVDSICYGTDELYTRATESLDLPLERVVIADHDTDWAYSLFPSLLCWRARGVRVDVLLPELGDKADGPYRRKLLRAMGIHITELSHETSVPLRSFVILPRDAAQLRAIVGVEKQSRSQTIEAVVYAGFLDASAIRAVLARLEALIKPCPMTPPVPIFAGDGHDVLLARIKSVGQYSKPSVEVDIENIPLERIVSLTRFVREYKYSQIRHLIDMYKRSGIALFDAAAVSLITGEKSIVTPPVVEESGGQYILVEGISSIKCVVVRGVTDPLPSTPVPLKQVRVVGRTLDTTQRYERFNYAHFRSIERSVHPFDSLG
jgi:predicted acylesterase/phospholipase RssA